MATRIVNGGSLQAAHDAAAAGDTLDVKAGTYGKLNWTKKLTIDGNGVAVIAGTGTTVTVRTTAAGSVLRNFADIRGSTGKSLACVLLERAHDVTIEGNNIGDGEQYGIRTYEADRFKILGNAIRRVGAGIMVTRNGAGSVISGNEIGPIDKMITDDGTAATNGGDGIQLIDNASGVLIEDNDFTANRAKTVGGSSWKYDGGATTGYGKCGAVTFRNNRIDDCVNVMEMGTDASKGGVPTGWVIEDNEAWGNADVAPDESRSCVGFFLRANNTFIIRRNKLHELDDFFMRLVATGQYAGSMTGNLVTDNDFWVKAGASKTYTWNRAYVVHDSVVPSTWGKIEGNRIYFDAAKSPQVAELTGKGATRDLAVWKTWTGWGTGETWGSGSPVDPCLAIKAERDAALAQLVTTNVNLTAATNALSVANGKVTTLTAERDAAVAKLGQAKALASQITAL